jgi:hypothetical protein
MVVGITSKGSTWLFKLIIHKSGDRQYMKAQTLWLIICIQIYLTENV